MKSEEPTAAEAVREFRRRAQTTPYVRRLAVGIDPGLTGALAVVTDENQAVVVDLPSYRVAGSKAGSTKGMIDYPAVAELLAGLSLADFTGAYDPRSYAVKAACEAPQAGNKSRGAQRENPALAAARANIAMQAGLSAGLWPLAFAQARVPFRFVQPAAWKKKYKLVGLADAEKKKAALAQARTLYPDLPLGRVKDHNRAEAVLIARYVLDTDF